MIVTFFVYTPIISLNQPNLIHLTLDAFPAQLKNPHITLYFPLPHRLILCSWISWDLHLQIQPTVDGVVVQWHLVKKNSGISCPGEVQTCIAQRSNILFSKYVLSVIIRAETSFLLSSPTDSLLLKSYLSLNQMKSL